MLASYDSNIEQHMLMLVAEKSLSSRLPCTLFLLGVCASRTMRGLFLCDMF